MLVNHSDEITVLAVAIRITIVFKGVAESRFADLRFFCAANVTETVQNFSSGTGSRQFNAVFSRVGVRNFSGEITLRTVAGDIALVVEYVSKRFTNGSGFRFAAQAAEFGFDCRGFAGCFRGYNPIGKIMYVLTGSSAVVADCITRIVVRVFKNGSYSTAHVTIRITCVIISMRFCNSGLAANITVGIADGGVNVVGSNSQFAANVTSGVASVGVYVIIGETNRAANVTSFVAGVRVNVLYVSRFAANIAITVAICRISVVFGSSRRAAGVTFGVTVAGVGVFKRGARCFANVAGGVDTIGKGVLGFRCARTIGTFVTRGIARTGICVLAVCRSAAACQREKHKCQGQCE